MCIVSADQTNHQRSAGLCCRTDKVPGVFSFLGIRNESIGSVHGLHTPRFTMDEGQLPLVRPTQFDKTMPSVLLVPDVVGYASPLHRNWNDRPTQCKGVMVWRRARRYMPAWPSQACNGPLVLPKLQAPQHQGMWSCELTEAISKAVPVRDIAVARH